MKREIFSLNRRLTGRLGSWQQPPRTEGEMEASGAVGAGPDATGPRGPGGAGRCWVASWWPVEGPFLGFNFLRKTGSKREERGKRRKDSGGSEFVITKSL